MSDTIFTKIAERILKHYSEKEIGHSMLEYFELRIQVCRDNNGRTASVFMSILLFFQLLFFLMFENFTWSIVMYKNYLKIGLRNILKQKLYSFINIAGLAIGLTCCLLIMLWVQYEMSFDKFHNNYDNLYKIVTDWEWGNQILKELNNPMPLGNELKKIYPEVTHSTRYMEWSMFRVEADEKVRFDLKVGFADQDFFEMFSFPILSGDPETYFNDKNSVVLTKKTASYFFGDKDPLGETILFENQKIPLIVTGIVEDPPDNSHMQFNVLVTLYNYESGRVDPESWKATTWGTYILTNSKIEPDSYDNTISELYKTHNIERMKSTLQPLKEIHMKSKVDQDSANHYKIDIKDVYIFVSIALIVFMIACINFMCMATARSAKREKEVGVRKISGALKSDLIKQFMSESFILVIFSLVTSLILAYFFLPLINEISGKDINFSLLNKWHLLISISLVTLTTGILSGSYPALFLSSIQPVRLFQGKYEGKTKGINLRKSLVTIQYSFTIVLLIVSMVLFSQLNFINNKHLGYDYENIISLGLHGDAQRIESIRTELLKHNNIISVSKGMPPGLRDSGHPTTNIDWDGKQSNQTIEFDWLPVYYGFDELFNMEIIQGRFLSREHPADTSNFVINETAVKEMGIEDPIGKQLKWYKTEGLIVGVIKDFHLSSLRTRIKPTVFVHSIYFGLYARIRPDNLGETIKHVQSVWKKFEPEKPFKYSFFDERIERMYDEERKTGTIIRYFTILAIAVFFLGLFGLIGFISEQRTKEIGIRKVLGASISGITAMVFKDFIKLLLYASVFAFPIGYYFSSKWLNNFAYKIDLNVWVFALTFIFILVFTFLIIFYQTVKVARLNPVDTLRYE